MRSELIDGRHLARRAVIYIRQSTPHQILTNQESLRLQYDLRRRALDLGWREEDVEVIDSDLGLSGAAAVHRAGFKDLIARVTLGQVGIVLSSEVTRLNRNGTDWCPLLDLCGYRQCLIGDRDGIYDPASANGRLLLGLKGTISEMELHTIRARLTAGLLNKAERGELGLMLPVGLVRDAAGIVVKDPDIAAGPGPRPCPVAGRSPRRCRPSSSSGRAGPGAGCPVWPSGARSCSSGRPGPRPATTARSECPSGGPPGSSPRWRGDFFKKLQR